MGLIVRETLLSHGYVSVRLHRPPSASHSHTEHGRVTVSWSRSSEYRWKYSEQTCVHFVKYLLFVITRNFSCYYKIISHVITLYCIIVIRYQIIQFLQETCNKQYVTLTCHNTKLSCYFTKPTNLIKAFPMLPEETL